ncbi:MAG: hypothetical protein O2826_01150 [Chloroflexi bacterium]|nr:hypothetical protein [Chloroflexota bacterium]MDA1173111.1 hypothetical protein [Chloroflexota bacterium]
MSRFEKESPERQIPWLAGERFELALDSHEGAINASTAGKDTLTITTRRVIRLGRQGGVRTTAVVPLDRLTAVEVSDVERDTGRLMNGMIALVIGAALAGITWAIFETTMFSLVAGGVPTLIAVFMISGYVFPDDDGALLLHASGYTLRQPLLSSESRRDAYLVAHRVYELMSVIAPPASAVAPAEQPQQSFNDQVPAYLDSQALPTAVSDGLSVSASGAAASLASVLTSRFEPAAEPTGVSDVAGRVARSVAATESASSYVTRQIIRDPAHFELTAGDYVWDLEFVAPDRFRVSQTGWSSTGEVRERWVSIGREFYRLAGTWQKPDDPSRFDSERQLNAHLTVAKYINVLRQGYPTAHEYNVSGGKQYLQVRYEPLGRESLASVLGNPSPPQGVLGAATIWIDCETDLLTKAEVKITESNDGRQLLFEQAFASYDSGLAIEAPETAKGPESIN